MSVSHLYVLLRNVCIQILCLFWIGVFGFPVLSHMGSLYVLEIKPLSDILLANIFSHTVDSLFKGQGWAGPWVPFAATISALYPAGFNGIGPQEPAYLVIAEESSERSPLGSPFLSPMDMRPAGGFWAGPDCSTGGVWACLSLPRYFYSAGVEVCLAAENF